MTLKFRDVTSQILEFFTWAFGNEFSNHPGIGLQVIQSRQWISLHGIHNLRRRSAQKADHYLGQCFRVVLMDLMAGAIDIHAPAISDGVEAPLHVGPQGLPTLFS
jgi:hypothetical protein